METPDARGTPTIEFQEIYVSFLYNNKHRQSEMVTQVPNLKKNFVQIDEVQSIKGIKFALSSKNWSMVMSQIKFG